MVSIYWKGRQKSTQVSVGLCLLAWLYCCPTPVLSFYWISKSFPSSVQGGLIPISPFTVGQSAFPFLYVGQSTIPFLYVGQSAFPFLFAKVPPILFMLAKVPPILFTLARVPSRFYHIRQPSFSSRRIHGIKGAYDRFSSDRNVVSIHE